MRIAMIGSGYVGLVSGACFADFGHRVVCVDKNANRIAALKEGEVPIFEPGLEDIVASNTAAGRLAFTTDLAEALERVDVVFIAVGTPSRRGDGHADLTYVHAAAREIAEASPSTVVVVKSTVPVGTCDEVSRIMGETGPGKSFEVVSNPEFLREGAAIKDFKKPDRIVVGVDNDHARATMAEVYRPLGLNPGQIQYTTRRTAELIKYAANAFLAMKVSYINEIADLCESVGADVSEVATGIGMDARIGRAFLNAGPGYGGSCFPKDTRALLKVAQDAGARMQLVETTIAVNDARKRGMARKVIAAAGGNVRGRNVGVLGLAFKPDTDDVRESPALAVITALQDAGAQVSAFDPEGMDQARKELRDVTFADDAYSCASGTDALVLVTEWDSFRALDFDRLRAEMNTPVLVDLRNVYRGDEMARRGFRYVCIGRPDESRRPGLSEAAE